MITGARRGELCGMRWQHIDFITGTITLRRSVGQDGNTVFEKDTKTHQQRRVTIDSETIDVLKGHRDRCEARAESLGVQLPSDAYVFSLSLTGEHQLAPDAVSQRYRKLATRLGIKTTLHKLRHYSATAGFKDASPTSIEYVYGTRDALNRHAMGATIDGAIGQAPSVLVQATGNFTWIRSAPMGGNPRSTGTAFALVIDQQTGNVTDRGISKLPIDLSPLGPIFHPTMPKQ
jgi:integrase